MLPQKSNRHQTHYLIIWWQLKKIFLIGSIGVMVIGFLSLTTLHRFESVGQSSNPTKPMYIKSECNTDSMKNN
ncbi:hypothetical protein PCC7424_4632 [Gloeothece citriformis PCC 7424]|uniref:Uncharacterized protein n=1 Tax=Gloeothece citriformis (strain PCC 7424) TaxID=65393 RepID=B7KBL6_GLOC7|nr:hypothetical protein [Gloeothece citriformis]ACK72994.1 hypothetical protein PCC7424_4632 [Gloeothece citriformis PCC 7424]